MILPTWLKDMSPTAVVAIVAIFAIIHLCRQHNKSQKDLTAAYMDSLKEMGESRDKERKEHMSMLERKDERVAKIIENISAVSDKTLGFLYTVIHQCQAFVPEQLRVKPEEVEKITR